MAIGDAYCTDEEFKSWVGVDDALDANESPVIRKAASRKVEEYCGRQFNDAGSATARVYHPNSSTCLRLDEFHTTSGLIVATDTGDDGTYETTISASNYTVYPLNGIKDGQTGWPYDRIELRNAATFPAVTGPAVSVTARWGWAAVPDDVKTATLIQAAFLLGRRRSRNGLDSGVWVSRLPLDPTAASLLMRFSNAGRKVA